MEILAFASSSGHLEVDPDPQNANCMCANVLCVTGRTNELASERTSERTIRVRVREPTEVRAHRVLFVEGLGFWPDPFAAACLSRSPFRSAWPSALGIWPKLLLAPLRKPRSLLEVRYSCVAANPRVRFEALACKKPCARPTGDLLMQVAPFRPKTAAMARGRHTLGFRGPVSPSTPRT
jgi:hypothetical protein